MLNLLIANKNLQNLQDLLNYISQYVPDIRVSYLAKSLKEVISATAQYHYDIILIDCALSNYNEEKILKKLPEHAKSKYYKSIIFLTNNKDSLETLKTNDLTFDAILNTEPIYVIINSLKKIIATKKDEENTSTVKTKIINELQNIGYNLSHNGTHYIAESVLLIAKFKYDSENLSKNVYPKVSQIYNKSLNNIKTNIITATDAACKNMNKNIIKKYLKIPDNIKPTAKMVINSISKKLE